MKKLLIITSSNFPYGSASANLLRLMGRGLVQQGWELEFLLQRGRSTNDKEDIPPRRGKEQGLSYYFCGYRLRPRNVFLKIVDSWVSNGVALWRILQKKLKREVDIVFLYNSSGIECFLLFVGCKILRIKVKAYVSEWYEKASVVRSWRYFPRWWDFLLRMKWVNPCFDGLVMPSHFLFNYYKNEKHILESRLYILPNLVNLSCFENVEEDRDYPKRGIRIGYCGTPTRKDGAEDLIKAFAMVQAEAPETELMLIGGSVGDAQLLPNLKRLAAELGMEENIIFTGLVSFSRMPGLLHSCDILALARPSGIFAEAGFPTKLGEYMACKKPVVLTRVGDMPRYLTHQKNAMLADPDQPEDFSKQILWLINHPEEASQIAEQGRCWAAEALGYQKATKAFSEFLQANK